MPERTLQRNLYIQNKITIINSPNFELDPGGRDLFENTTEMQNFVDANFVAFVNIDGNKEILIQCLRELNFVKNTIKDIANNFFFIKSTLINFYEKEVQKLFFSNIAKENYLTQVNNVLRQLSLAPELASMYRFVKNDTEKLLSKQFDFLKTNGFPTNLNYLNSGVMIANQGDSSQFFFLARAIQAGYNCSNVDVRSSKYDAIIDMGGDLKRIQIKGVSGNSVSFLGRDRGGQGIDHTHVRNRGGWITSDDCDFYVAVDRFVGICYIIPISFIEGRRANNTPSVNLNDLQAFKEMWSNFDTEIPGPTRNV